MSDSYESSQLALMNSEESFNFYDPSIIHDRVLLVEGRKFYVQSGYLCVWSTYFRTLFNSHFKENEEEIELKDVSAQDFYVFLQVIYPGSFTVQAYDIEPLVYLSYRFLAPAARRICEQVIDKNFDDLEKIALFEIAVKYEMEELKTKSLDFIKENVKSFNPIQLLKFAFEYNLEDLKKKLRCLIYSAKRIPYFFQCEDCLDKIKRATCTHTEEKIPYTRIEFMAQHINEIINLPDEIKNFVILSTISYI